jgi:hypothetical protein
MRIIRCFVLVLVMLSIAVPTLSLQFRRPRPGSADSEPIEEKWERQRKKARNEERQKDLMQDTEKLLRLATELKQHVDKTDENTLSLDVIKKTEEIEKLAKKVREKMKAEYMMPGPSIVPMR